MALGGPLGPLFQSVVELASTRPDILQSLTSHYQQKQAPPPQPKPQPVRPPYSGANPLPNDVRGNNAQGMGVQMLRTPPHLLNQQPSHLGLPPYAPGWRNPQQNSPAYSPVSGALHSMQQQASGLVNQGQQMGNALMSGVKDFATNPQYRHQVHQDFNQTFGGTQDTGWKGNLRAVAGLGANAVLNAATDNAFGAATGMLHNLPKLPPGRPLAPARVPNYFLDHLEGLPKGERIPNPALDHVDLSKIHGPNGTPDGMPSDIWRQIQERDRLEAAGQTEIQKRKRDILSGITPERKQAFKDMFGKSPDTPEEQALARGTVYHDASQASAEMRHGVKVVPIRGAKALDSGGVHTNLTFRLQHPELGSTYSKLENGTTGTRGEVLLSDVGKELLPVPGGTGNPVQHAELGYVELPEGNPIRDKGNLFQPGLYSHSVDFGPQYKKAFDRQGHMVTPAEYRALPNHPDWVPLHYTTKLTGYMDPHGENILIDPVSGAPKLIDGGYTAQKRVGLIRKEHSWDPNVSDDYVFLRPNTSHFGNYGAAINPHLADPAKLEKFLRDSLDYSRRMQTQLTDEKLRDLAYRYQHVPEYADPVGVLFRQPQLQPENILSTLRHNRDAIPGEIEAQLTKVRAAKGKPAGPPEPNAGKINFRVKEDDEFIPEWRKKQNGGH